MTLALIIIDLTLTLLGGLWMYFEYQRFQQRHATIQVLNNCLKHLDTIEGLQKDIGALDRLLESTPEMAKSMDGLRKNSDEVTAQLRLVLRKIQPDVDERVEKALSLLSTAIRPLGEPGSQNTAVSPRPTPAASRTIVGMRTS